MKRYIRLEEDKILDMENNSITNELMFNSMIVVESDDITDLFDEFVTVTRNHICEVIVNNSYHTKYEIEKAIAYGCSIYGAIWTEKGLIYVAKLNENEQWEII